MTQLEDRLRQLGSEFPYPETPRIVVPLQPRRTQMLPRLAGALAIALILVLLAVPPVRAAVGEILQIGIVRILQGESLPAPTGSPFELPAGARTVLDLPGATDLAAAQEAVDFELRVPTDLGTPDHVFLLEGAGPAVAMAWLDPERPSLPRAALYIFPPNSVLRKLMPQTLEPVRVGDEDGLWAGGAHYYELPLERETLRLYVPGGVLIWTEDALTYRLETTEPLSRALEIAESLR